ncbi:MAG: hypothetical protein ACSLEW_09915 [Nocardioides sp.]
MRVPKPLVVSASIAVLQAGVLVVLAVLELINISSDRLALGLTTTAFFLLVAAALVGCAWGLMGLRSPARSPLVLAQLIFLGVASSFAGWPAVALAIAVPAVACLVGIFHPASLAALEVE